MICTDRVCKQRVSKIELRVTCTVRGFSKGNEATREMALARDMAKEKEKCDVIEGTEKKTLSGREPLTPVKHYRDFL